MYLLCFGAEQVRSVTSLYLCCTAVREEGQLWSLVRDVKRKLLEACNRDYDAGGGEQWL